MSRAGQPTGCAILRGRGGGGEGRLLAPLGLGGGGDRKLDPPPRPAGMPLLPVVINWHFAVPGATCAGDSSAT